MSVWIVYERGCVHTYRRCRTHTACGVRTPSTVRVHSRTLPTLTDAHSREPTIGDGLMRLRCLETVCVRSPHVQTECLHEATARDGVCTQKCDNPRTCTCLYDIIKTARTWFLPLGLYMLVRALVRMHVSHWARILVQVTINRRLLIGRDGHLDQSEAYDLS